MCGTRSRQPQNQARCRLTGRSRAVDAATSARPYCCWRSSGRRSPRYAQSLEHRPSGRDRHRSRQFGTGSSLPHRTAHSGSRRHGAASSDRRSHRRGRVYRRSWQHAPRRSYRRGGGDHRGQRLRTHHTFWPTNARALTKENSMKARHVIPIAVLLLATSTSAALAAGTDMPWEAPLQNILDSIQGPVAKSLAVIIIIITGLTLAFGETSGGFRRLIQIVLGLSIAFAASSFFLSFFSFGGGALIS